MSIIQNVRHLSDVRSSSLHAHIGYHQMIYVRRGRVDFSIEGQAYTVTGASVVFIGCQERHSVTVRGDTYERIVVDLYPHKLGGPTNFRLLSVFSDRPSGFCHVVALEDTAALEALLLLLFEEWKRQDREFADAPERLLCDALLLLYRISPTPFPPAIEGRRIVTVRRIKARLESALCDPPSLEELGRELHMNPYYLSHLFKELTGYSIKNYHLLCRLAAARELLETTSESVTEIAARAGFGDAGSLSRYLRREMGCTPSQYRKQLQHQRHNGKEETTL